MQQREGRYIGSARENQLRTTKQKKKRMAAWKLAIIDVLCAGLFLCVFCYFHHVNPIRQEIDPVQLPIATPTPSATASPTSTAGTSQPTQTGSPAPTPSKEPSKFLAAGETPQLTDTGYITENVNVQVDTRTWGKSICHVAEIYVSDVTYLKTHFSGGQYKTGWSKRDAIDVIASEANAFLAINGDQYAARSEGIVVRDGVLYRKKVFRDVCLLHMDGTLETIKQADFDASKLSESQLWQGWSFGPVLLENGQPMTKFNCDATVARGNPRAAIGMVEPGHYFLVTVEGRNGLVGMTMSELSQFMYELGCKTAYNLDGGATAQMAVNGKIYSESSGDRGVTDIVYIGLE